MKIKAYYVVENLAIMYEIVGEEKFLEIIRMYGGSNLYIPTYKSVVRSSRNREIAKRYNGINASQLAREYGITVNQIRNIVNM
ncbi:Mor transcription activator family protein [Romboutsia timonensis]|uniref:Mor transcription activator family protein n=1 Tax=Romboutsia timonensis TaxID=1776391 RepID=UPI002A803804|nr:Mor transcription activator family protein [Romboutsia timonensis]MDY3958422.1 Mor transcription activator family protein [Romboutsia timonensis]